MKTPSPNQWTAIRLLLFFNFYLFIFGCAVSFVAAPDFSLVSVSRGYSPVAVHRHLTEVASLVAEHGLYGTWASGVAAPGL